MWLSQDNPAPSHMTIDNFMKDYLVNCIDDILSEINSYIFKQEQVDLSHIYIDGTKITANANKYSWVWKKSNVKNRDKKLWSLKSCLRVAFRIESRKTNNYN